MLTEHRSILDNMARVLVERETIYTAEVDMLMKGAGYAEVLAYMEEHDKDMPDEPFGKAEDVKSEPESTDMGGSDAVKGEKEGTHAKGGAKKSENPDTDGESE